MEHHSWILSPLSPCGQFQMSCHFWVWILSCSFWVCSAIAELVFSVQPEDGVGVLDGAFMLPCAVYDSNLQRLLPVQWERHSGEPLLDLGVHQLANGSLFFPHLREQDFGKYTCTAHTGSNSIRATVNIEKADLQSVFYSPASQVVSEGQAVFLQCVSGDSLPPAHITWEKDGWLFTKGTQIQGQYGGGSQKKTSGTLHLTNVSKEDEGEYVCVTHNTLLRVHMESDSAKLTVQGSLARLEITRGPDNIIVATETEAALQCAVQGFPLPTVYWFKNSQPLQNNSHWTLQNNGQLLFIKNVSEEDEGFYYCVAKNERNTVRSQPAFLLPAVMEWVFVQQPNNVTATQEESVTLACRPPRSRPPAQVSWFKNNRLLTPMPHLTLQLNGDLLFHSIQDTDRGIYFCRASNAHLFRAVSSRKVYLNVLAPPFVEVWPVLATVPLGSAVWFQCQVSGHPPPSIKWSKQGQSVITGGKVTIAERNATLYISSVKSYDKGFYTCEASNVVGHAQGTASLHVTVPPVIVSFVAKISSIEGTSVVLPCQAVGDSPIMYSWSSGVHQTPISTSPKMQIDYGGALYISSVKQSDMGEYHCTAENNAGRDQRTIILIVLAEDDPGGADAENKKEVFGVTTSRTDQGMSDNLNNDARYLQDLKMTDLTSKMLGSCIQLFKHFPEATLVEGVVPGVSTISDSTVSASVPQALEISMGKDSNAPHRAQSLLPAMSSEFSLYPSLSPEWIPSGLVADLGNSAELALKRDRLAGTTKFSVPYPKQTIMPHSNWNEVTPGTYMEISTTSLAHHSLSLVPDSYSPPSNFQLSSTTPHFLSPEALTLSTEAHSMSPDHKILPSQPQTLPFDAHSQFNDPYSQIFNSNSQPHSPSLSEADKVLASSSKQQNWSQSIGPADHSNAELTERPKKNMSQLPMRTNNTTTRVKQQSSSWLPMLEKHDIPIVVGVGVSLAFIFITMAFYSLVQKNDPAPLGRAAQRNLGFHHGHSGHLETRRTYENRAFEDDNIGGIVEQSPDTPGMTALMPAVAMVMEPTDNKTEQSQPIHEKTATAASDPEPKKESQPTLLPSLLPPLFLDQEAAHN
ncbi:hypothetical protein MATL_G00068150 [Megalops atlanticus]|uniref:Ig-like domain-containing protein n=1 Tax=Megalops atlanticus TaxID=7932 RepID=A0A9D3Q868_MEGAT|nr:hypothetical protein MATL_G00068150 [Megalops atlanticus]